MPTVPATRRLSPKVRRLLQDHGLQARSLPGTGTGGRVTPTDVLGAAGVARRSTPDSVLASPLARRLLRDAGLDLAAAARAHGQRHITRSDAEGLIDELSEGTGADHAPTERSRGTTTEVEADVGRLLAALAAVDGDFLASTGFALTVPVAVASAVAAVLVRRPDLARRTAAPDDGDGRTYPSVHLGLVRPGADRPDPVVVPDVQYLSVAGLARRAQAAGARVGLDEPDAPGAPTATLVVGTETAPDGLAASDGMGRLTVGTPAARQVVHVDDLGNEVVRTRPHATLRLHHDERTSREAAAAFLEELAGAVTSWSLPVGP